MKRKILVTGATGTIGRHTVNELVRRGHSVTAMVRHGGVGQEISGPRSRRPCQERSHVERAAPEHSGLALAGARSVTAEASQPADIRRCLENSDADVVVSCIASRSGAAADAWAVDYRANSELLKAAAETAVTHFILLSAICVQKPKLAFQRAKLAFEAELQASGLTYSIVRPTAFFKSLSGQIARVKAGKPFMLFGDGRLNACKPISASDVARFIADCLEQQRLRNAILPVGGPGEAVTPVEQGTMLFEILGKPPVFRRVPLAMMHGIVSTLNVLERLHASLAAKAELARIARYYAQESMLVWDPREERYRPELTPSYGVETLEEFYRQALNDDHWQSELGAQAIF